MKFIKIKHILLLTNILALSTLVIASTSVSAQTGVYVTPAPPSENLLMADTQVYLPFIVRPSPPDLLVGGFEVTQAVQNLNNTVSLVAGKSTVVRVYVQTDYDGLSGVYVSLSATRNGSPLAGSPLTLGPKPITNTWSRGELSNSFNFSLPAAWLSGSVTLQMRVDPSNAILEGNETNNLITTVANFTNVPALNIKVVPIEYTDPETNLTYPPASYSFIAPGLLRMFPISMATVTNRATIPWDKNLRKVTSWEDLLTQIWVIKNFDGAPSWQIYYGLVPLFHSNGTTWLTPAKGAISGIGYVGLRASAGFADASERWPFLDGSETSNHEFGHNLGRIHTKCPVTLAGDNNYPYYGGWIGQYGLRIDNMQLFDPAIYTDIMGYCQPVWISDYTYQGLFNNQVVAGAAPQLAQPIVPSLMVRARLPADGTVLLEPVYTFNGRPEPLPEESDYLLELLGENGQTVASYPLPVLNAEEETFSFESINTVVPLPEEPFSSLRITEQGAPAAQRSMSPASLRAQAMPALDTSAQGAVLNWGQPTTPAVARYQLEGEETWTTLAVDHLGGSLELDSPSLPQGKLHFEIILADQPGSTVTLDWENIP